MSVSSQIFVNLPVKNLQKSVEFFTALGFSFNPQFTDDNATCMIVADNIFVMLLVEPYFQGFTPRAICDTTKNTEVLLALSVENRGKVDAMVHKAVAGGGKTYSEPKDHGFMCQHGFHDLDGHTWEIFWMDPSGIQR
jgi:predicted lactoylglutathione lyase